MWVGRNTHGYFFGRACACFFRLLPPTSLRTSFFTMSLHSLVLASNLPPSSRNACLYRTANPAHVKLPLLFPAHPDAIFFGVWPPPGTSLLPPPVGRPHSRLNPFPPNLSGGDRCRAIGQLFFPLPPLPPKECTFPLRVIGHLGDFGSPFHFFPAPQARRPNGLPHTLLSSPVTFPQAFH